MFRAGSRRPPPHFASSWRKRGLSERIAEALAGLDVDDVAKLARVGAEIRGWIVEAPLPAALKAEIEAAYGKLNADHPGISVAVRSSATAEDLPDASFAGQQETFLNISGLDNLLHAIREVFASLYNDRAIAYRVHQGYADTEVALSVGVQRMVRSDQGAAGVMFTIDTESGFDQVVFITASYGLGETVVQGAVNPDEFYVYKPNLAAGRPAILRKSVGRKGDQDDLRRQGRRRQVGDDRRRARGRAAALFDHRRRGRGARPLRARHREALRPGDGHRVGPRRRRRQALHPAGAARDREVAGVGRRQSAPLPARIEIEGAGERPRHRPEDRAGGGAAGQVVGRNGQGRRRRRAGHRHDRPGLGAGDEARRGDRHQSRRTHLPRGDHRARARHSRGRRLRRRDAGALRRTGSHGVVRRRRHRARLRRAA